MVQRQHLGIAGLFVDPNPHVAVPEGALSQADNCVIRRVGEIEPRPGFKKLGGGAMNDGAYQLSTIEALFSYSGAMVAVGMHVPEVGDPFHVTALSSAHSVRDEDTGHLQWARDYMRSQEVRGNLYLSTIDQVRKLQAVGANQVAHPVGVIPPIITRALATLASGPGVLPDQMQVAYRAVIARTDANGVITRSAPSAYVMAANDQGSPQDMSIIVGWIGAQVDDVLELYRTETHAIGPAPPADFYLAQKFVIDTAGAGNETLVDALEENDLTAPLYTNDDEEGEENANWRPPVCGDVALYAGSIFYMAHRAHAAFDLDIATTDWSGSTTGCGFRQALATLTNGSAVMSDLSASELAGLQVGQLVTHVLDGSLPEWAWVADAAPIRIVSIDTGAGTATLSDEWDDTTGSYSVVISDSLKIVVDGDTLYYPLITQSSVLAAMVTSGGTGFGPMGAYGTYLPAPGLFLYAFGRGSWWTNDEATEDPGDFTRRRVRIEALSALTSFTASASHGDEIVTPLPLHSQTAQTVAPEVHPERLGWSKTNEPEHYLLSSFQDLGNGSVLLRGIATRDALWLLKGQGDGIYRLSGFGASSGFRIDQVDSSTHLLHPTLACALEDRVYAWTNRGLVAISDSGVQPLSAPMIGSLTRALEIALDYTESWPGSFAVANPKAGEVIFGLPGLDLSGNGYAADVYVYNTRTNAFTKWFPDADAYACGATDLSTRGLWLGRADSGEPELERLETEDVLNADEEYSVDVLSMTATTGARADVEIDTGSGWEPEVGDMLVRGAVTGLVTAVTDTEHFEIERADEAATSTGSGTAYKAIACAFAWRSKAADAPGMSKRFQELITHWESVFGLYAWQLQLLSAHSLSDESTLSYERSALTRAAADVDQQMDHRAMVPRDNVLSSRLVLPAVGITQADARWRLSGMSLTFEPVATRVSR